MNKEYRERVDFLFLKFRQGILSKKESREFFGYSNSDHGLRSAIQEHRNLIKAIKKSKFVFPWNWVGYFVVSIIICFYLFDSAFPRYSVIFRPQSSIVNPKAAKEFRESIGINLQNQNNKSPQFVAADGIAQYLRILALKNTVVEEKSLDDLKKLTERLDELMEQGRLLIELLDSIEERKIKEAKEIYAEIDFQEGTDFQVVMVEIGKLLDQWDS